MKKFILAQAGEKLNLRKNFWIFYLFYCLFIVLGGICSEGWMQADEHFRVLEPAHKIVYRSATLPWEFSTSFPIVSYLLGYIYAPLFFLTKALGLSGLQEAIAARIVTGLIASTRIIAVYFLVKLLPLKKQRQGLYTLLYALCMFTPVYLVRTSQENWCATALLWACVLLLKAYSATERTWLGIGAGALLALAFSFRFQAGFCLLGLAVLTIPLVREKGIVWLLLGGIIGLVPLALADWAATGIPFLPAYNYLTYALGGEEGGQVWGTSPWYTYLTAFFTLWYPPFSVVLGVFLLIGTFISPILAAIFWPFTIVHFLLGHKEIRYFSPMLPFMVLACAVGWEYCELRFADLFAKPYAQRALKIAHGYFLGAVVLAVGWVLVPQNTFPSFVAMLSDRAKSHGPEKDFALVFNSRTNLPLFYFYHEENLPAQFSTGEFFTGLKLLPPSEKAYGYALGAVEMYEIDQARKYCEIESLSLHRVLGILYGFHPKVPRVKRANAFVYCHLSPETLKNAIAKNFEP